MANSPREAYTAFAGDYRKAGTTSTKRRISPTLRLKALTAAALASVMLWGIAIYIVTGSM